MTPTIPEHPRAAENLQILEEIRAALEARMTDEFNAALSLWLDLLTSQIDEAAPCR